MDSTNIFLIVVVSLLANIEGVAGLIFRPRSNQIESSLSNFYRRESCTGGNLLQIHTHRCTNGRCKAKCDGTKTTKPKARFTMIDITTTGKKCIQFTDNHDNKYALKAVNGSNVAQFEKRVECDEKVGHEFQFDRKKGTQDGRKSVYKDSNGRCLGVAESCDDTTLYLIRTDGDSNNRNCFFENL